MRVILANFLTAILVACSAGCVMMAFHPEEDREARTLDRAALTIEVLSRRLDGRAGPSGDCLRRAAENRRTKVKRDFTVGAALCGLGALTSFLVGRRLTDPPVAVEP